MRARVLFFPSFVSILMWNENGVHAANSIFIEFVCFSHRRTHNGRVKICGHKKIKNASAAGGGARSKHMYQFVMDN